MEKIQAALDKARKSRNAPASVILTQVPVSPNNGPVDVGEAWAALQPCQPDLARMVRNRIIAFASGANAVPFDIIRTRVIQQMRANSWRRLAITSPTPACGKSTIALNLAFSLARQSEFRTVLAEIDLRRPTLAATLGLTAAVRTRPGFSSVLEDGTAFASVALRCSTGLALGLNHGPVRNSAELLQGSSVTPALAAIEERYAPDLMLFDMPPMLVTDDVMAFLNQVDAVLLIAGAETTTIKEIDTCERELASQTNVMGIVLNKCNYMDRNQSYSYYG